MTPSHRSFLSSAAATLIVTAIVLLASCAPTKTQNFATSFLPAAPVPPEDEAPPTIAPRLYANETPKLAVRVLPAPAGPTEIDARILQADEHFQAGKKAYQQSDPETARREFDLAVDALLAAPEGLPGRQRLEHKLDQLVDTIYRYDLEGLGASQPAQQGVIYDKPPFDGILEMTFPTDPNLKPKVKEELAATVSQLPLEENDAVLSYIHYFSTDHGRRTLVANLRRSGRYRPMIHRILDEEGVPQELIYLAQIESGFYPRAISRKRAAGMWQFVQFRGQEYGLEQTSSTDDRFDPEKATRAAARHLRDLYQHFGDWYLAMAAYNCGPGCVDKAVERTGYADYWELSRLNALPRDTINYVPVILAITIIEKNPKDYGLDDIDSDPPLEYDTVELHCPTNIALIADAADHPVSEIEDLNPALIKPVAPAGYPMHVPVGSAPAVMAALDNVPEPHRDNWRMHRVLSGETLAEIARQYATPISAIAQANQSVGDAPEAGDLLIIPAAYHPPASSHVAAGAHSRRLTTRAARKQSASRSGSSKVVHGRGATRPAGTAGIATSRRFAAN